MKPSWKDKYSREPGSCKGDGGWMGVDVEIDAPLARKARWCQRRGCPPFPIRHAARSRTSRRVTLRCVQHSVGRIPVSRYQLFYS